MISQVHVDRRKPDIALAYRFSWLGRGRVALLNTPVHPLEPTVDTEPNIVCLRTVIVEAYFGLIGFLTLEVAERETECARVVHIRVVA